MHRFKSLFERRVLLLAVFVLVAATRVQAIAPYASFEQVFEYGDGQISVNQTTQLRLSSDDSGGLLRVGGYVLNVQSLPPKLVYRATEVARIPESVTLHVEEACLVNSPLEADALMQQQRDVGDDSDESVQSASRRLLEQRYDGETQEAVAFYKDNCPTINYFDAALRRDAYWNAYRWVMVGWYNVLSDPKQSPKVANSRVMNILRSYATGSDGLLAGKSASQQGELLLWALRLQRPLTLDGTNIPPGGIANEYDFLKASACTNMYGRCWSKDWGRWSWNAVAPCSGNSLYGGGVLAAGCSYSFVPDPNLGIVAKGVNIYRRTDLTFYDASYEAVKDYYDSQGTCARFQELIASHPSTGNFANDALDSFAHSMVDALAAALTSQAETNTAIGFWSGKVDDSLAAINVLSAQQGDIEHKVTSLIAGQTKIDQQFLDFQGNVTSLISLMYDESLTNDHVLSGLIDSTNTRITNLSQATNDAINVKFNLLIGALKDVGTISSGRFEKLYRDVLYVSDMLQGVNSQLNSFVQQRDYNRILTQSYFNSVDKLVRQGSEEVPLVSGDAIRPTVLSGSLLKALVDAVSVSYVDNSGDSGTVTTLQFFADTHRMLNFSRPWATVEQLATWMGVQPCTVRASVSADVYNSSCNSTLSNCTSVHHDWRSPLFTNVTNYCTLWVESSTFHCNSGFNASLGECAGTNVTSTSLLTTLPSFLNAMSSQCAGTHANSTIEVTSYKLQKTFSLVHSNATCGTTLRDKLVLSATGKVDAVMGSLTFVWASYMASFQGNLRTLELIAYGALPNGIKTEIRALGYSPGPSQGLSGGSQNVQCMRGYWLSVHPNTLPVTSLTFDSTSSGASEVHVNIQSSPVCANGTACYLVTDSDLRVNYVFQEGGGVNVPPALAVVGDVTSPLFSGLYDVPAALIETTSNPLIRSNLLTYLMMPPGTPTTLSFDYFFTMTVGLFDAYVGSASAVAYKFPVVLDNDGYPVCNVASGLPVTASYVAPVNNCVPPFVWSGPAYQPVVNHGFTLAPPAAAAASCPVLVSGPLPGIIDGRAPVNFTWTTPSWSNRVSLLLSKLSYGANNVQNGISNYVVSGRTPSTRSPSAWTVSAWVTQTAAVVWPAVRCTLLDVQVVTGGGAFSITQRLGISIGPVTSNARYAHLQRVVVVTLDDVIFYVPSESPIPFELNTPVFISVVFITGVQASFNDPSAPYRIQLYVNGALMGSAIKGSDPDLGYNWNDGGFTALMSDFGGTFNFAAGASAVLTTDSLLVEHVKFYAWPLSSAQVKQESVCGLASLTSRCWLPPDSFMAQTVNNTNTNATNWMPPLLDTAVPIFALQKNRSACLSSSSGRLVSVSAGYDVTHPLIPPNVRLTPQFTFTFWMKFIRQDYPIVYEAADKSFYISRQFVLSVFPSANLVTDTLAAQIVNGTQPMLSGCVEYQLPDLSAGNDYAYHFYAIVVNNGRATLFVDGVQTVALVAAVQCSNGTNSIYQSLVDRHNARAATYAKDTQSYSGFWDENSVELLYYYTAALPQVLVSGEMTCELNSYSNSDGAVEAISPAKFVLPVAVCLTLPVAVGATSTVGYCRHAAMCGGNCAVYAGVDLVERIFTARQVQCDPGWLPPNCDKKCTVRDADGNCVSQSIDLSIGDGLISGLPTAYSTNGYWCQILKNYQVSPYAVNGQTFVSLGFRSYEYLTDITVPSGQITSLVAHGQCPSIALQPNGDGSMWIQFSNVFGDYSAVRIRTSSPSGCVSTYSLTLPPYSTTPWTVPGTCPSLAIEVDLDLGNALQSCRSLNATTVQDQLQQSAAAPVAANIQRSVTVSSNSVLQQLAIYNQQLAGLTFQVVSQVSQASANGIDISDLLDAVGAAISGMPVPSVEASYLVNITDLFVRNQQVEEKLRALQDLNRATSDAIQQQSQGVGDLNGMNAVYDLLQANVSQSVKAQHVANVALQNQINITNQVLANSVTQMQDAYDALHLALQGYVAPPSGDGSTLSSALRAFFTATGVITLLNTVALLVAYGPRAAKALNHLRRRRKESDGEESDDSDSEGDEGEEEASSGAEDEPELVRQATPAAQAIRAQRAHFNSSSYKY